MRLHSFLILAIAGLVSGCASMNNSIQGWVASWSPDDRGDRIDKIDGVYKGIATTVVARSPICPTDRFGTVFVGDRTLTFSLTPSTLFITPVQADGTVHTETTTSVLDGKIEGGRLTFTVRDAICVTSYDLRWVL